MASVNKVILIGNLGRDPETRYTTGGDAVTNLNIATSEQWKDKSGEKQERTEWHRVVLFGRQAEIAGEYLKKGRSVYIEGRLQTRKYTDKDGVEKYSTEIVGDRMQLLGSREGGGGGDVEFAGAVALMRILQAMRRCERPLQPIQLVGTVGKLTIPIREGGTGEIVYTVDGTRRCSGARSDDSKRPIARDTEVVITRYDKGIAYVCEFDRMIAR